MVNFERYTCYLVASKVLSKKVKENILLLLSQLGLSY